MNVLTFNKRSFAVGLHWMERGSKAGVVAHAVNFNAPYFVHWEKQTGYLSGESDSPEGLPSLSLALLRVVPKKFFMALVQSDEGAYALVKVRDRAVQADGESVFTERGAAIEAFEKARTMGYEPYATPGLVSGAETIDVAAIRGESDMTLAAVAFSGVSGKRAAAQAACVCLVALGGWWLWGNWAHVWGMFFKEEPAPFVAVPEERVDVVIDSVAFIQACRRARRDRQPWLAAWALVSLRCEARLDDATFLGVRPELAGQPVMLARWRLAAGHGETLHRQLAEARLGEWFSGGVNETAAWAMAPLPSVLKEAVRGAPPFLMLREALDLGLGPRGVSLGYEKAGPGETQWTIVMTTRQGLGDVARLVAGIDGLELTSISLDAGGGWRLVGRPLAPISMTVSKFEALTEEQGDDST